MAQFITTTFSSGNDIALQLGNEEWVRTLTIGSSWNYIRIGLLFQLVGTSNTPGGSGMAIGMCSGTSLPFNNASTQNFVGVEFVNSLTFNANAPNPYYSLGNTNMFACKKLGSSITTAPTNLADGIGIAFQTSGGTARRSIIYVDITKGSPNYTIGMMMSTSTYMAHDFTVADLLAGMTAPFANNWTLNGGANLFFGNGAQTLACDETAGGFDTVDIYSNELVNPMNIYEIAVEKLA